MKVHESPYAMFANNPVFFVDVDGADTSVINAGKGNVILIYDTDGATWDFDELKKQHPEYDFIEVEQKTQAKDFSDATILLDQYVQSHGDFANIVIWQHGHVGSISIGGGQYVTNKTILRYVKGKTKNLSSAQIAYLDGMKKMGTQVKENGNIVFIPCRAGVHTNGSQVYAFPKSMGFILLGNASNSSSFNIWMNQDPTTYYGNESEHEWQWPEGEWLPNYALISLNKRYLISGKGLTKDDNLIKGWSLIKKNASGVIIYVDINANLILRKTPTSSGELIELGEKVE